MLGWGRNDSGFKIGGLSKEVKLGSPREIHILMFIATPFPIARYGSNLNVCQQMNEENMAYVYIHTHIYIHTCIIYKYRHIYIHVHIDTHDIPVYTHTYIHMYTCVYMCVFTGISFSL